METQTETQRPNNTQLIFVPHQDTIRLLEVYVKRSLSLNDGTLRDNKAGRKDKWVTVPRRQRRHSSDPSLHLADDGEIGTFYPVEPAADQPETRPEEVLKPSKKPKKTKKPSFWKSFLGIFSRKSSNEKDEEQDPPSEIPEVATAEESSDSVITCLPTTPVNVQKRKAMRRKSLKKRLSRRLSVNKINRPGKDLNCADITRTEGEFED